MRVNSSDISLAASNFKKQYSSKYEYLHKWDKEKDITFKSYTENNEIKENSTVQKNILQSTQGTAAPIPVSSKTLNSLVGTDPVQQKRDLLKKVMAEYACGVRLKIAKDCIEAFTGKKISTPAIQDPTDPASAPVNTTTTSTPPQVQEQANPPQRPDWGISYYSREVHSEKEGVSFSASGVVNLDNGKKIEFSVTMEMSKEKYEEIETSFKAGAALIDPLMIDFSGKGISFLKSKFSFDLNNDGTLEEINALGDTGGFLAYDKNNNGIIDDGSELFGPSSGNGFLELSEFDSDKNGWVDENDPLFSKLKIWRIDKDLIQQVTSLKENDIGALYTKHVATAYEIKGDERKETPDGILRETGIYLKETGGTGLVQDIDFIT